MKKVHLLGGFGKRIGKRGLAQGNEEKGKAKGEANQPDSSGFWCEEKGQVSAEMLIIIAALIAVAIVLIGQLQNSAKTGAKNLEAKNAAAWKEIDQIG